MLSKESHYLTMGCIVFGTLAVPTMLGLLVHHQLRARPAISDANPTESLRAPAPRLREVSKSIETHAGQRPQRTGIQLSLEASIADESTLPNDSPKLIEVEVISERLHNGVELQFRVTNRTSKSLNLVNFELDYFGARHEHLGMGATSCFYLAPGESKVVSAVNYEAFAKRVHDYDVRLENVLGIDDEPVRGLQLKVTTHNLLHSS